VTAPAAAPSRHSNATIRRRREEGLFWITRQILRADDDAQRAGILLRIPDLVIAGRDKELIEACQACQFADGAAYVTVRAAVVSATRDETGQLPAEHADRLERCRCGMVAIAGKTSPALEFE